MPGLHAEAKAHDHGARGRRDQDREAPPASPRPRTPASTLLLSDSAVATNGVPSDRPLAWGL